MLPLNNEQMIGWGLSTIARYSYIQIYGYFWGIPDSPRMNWWCSLVFLILVRDTFSLTIMEVEMTILETKLIFQVAVFSTSMILKGRVSLSTLLHTLLLHHSLWPKPMNLPMPPPDLQSLAGRDEAIINQDSNYTCEIVSRCQCHKVLFQSQLTVERSEPILMGSQVMGFCRGGEFWCHL